MAVIIGGSNNTILSTTWANKPASYPVGQSVFITDAGANGSHWHYTGSKWRPVNGTYLMSSATAQSADIDNNDTIVFQYQLVAGLLQLTDRIRIYTAYSRSGTTDSATVTVKLGTAGTAADQNIISTAALTSTTTHGGAILDWRIESATTIQRLARNDFGYGGATTNSVNGVNTISNVSNSLYLSVLIKSAGTANTCKLQEAQLWHVVA